MDRFQVRVEEPQCDDGATQGIGLPTVKIGRKKGMDPEWHCPWFFHGNEMPQGQRFSHTMMQTWDHVPVMGE